MISTENKISGQVSNETVMAPLPQKEDAQCNYFRIWWPWVSNYLWLNFPFSVIFIFTTNGICKMYTDWLHFGNYHYWETNNFVSTDFSLGKVTCHFLKSVMGAHTGLCPGWSLPDARHCDLSGGESPHCTSSACRSSADLTPSSSFPQPREVSLTPHPHPHNLENYYLTHEPWIYVLPLGASVTYRLRWGPGVCSRKTLFLVSNYIRMFLKGTTGCSCGLLGFVLSIEDCLV